MQNDFLNLFVRGVPENKEPSYFCIHHVAYEKNVLKISKCGEGWNSNLTQELNVQRELSRYYNLVFFACKFIDRLHL